MLNGQKVCCIALHIMSHWMCYTVVAFAGSLYSLFCCSCDALHHVAILRCKFLLEAYIYWCSMCHAGANWSDETLYQISAREPCTRLTLSVLGTVNAYGMYHESMHLQWNSAKLVALNCMWGACSSSKQALWRQCSKNELSRVTFDVLVY